MAAAAAAAAALVLHRYETDRIHLFTLQVQYGVKLQPKKIKTY